MHPYANHIRPELAKILGDYRNTHHYTQERMAENLRISLRSYSDLELGKMNFSGPSLIFFVLTMTEAEQQAVIQKLREIVNRIDNG